FGFAGAQVRHEAIPLLQVHGSARKVETLVDIPTERSAGEVRVIHDGIKAVGFAIPSIAVAGSINNRSLVADPIAVIGKFEGAKLSIDINRSPGQTIEIVVTQDFVKGVTHIKTSN